MPPTWSARVLVIGAPVAGLIAVIVATVADWHRGVGPVPEFLLLTALLTLTWAFPLLMPKESGGVEALQLDESFVVCMALVLTPLGGILAFALGVGVGQLLRRRSLVKWMFNWGQMVASVGVAQLILVLLGHPGPAQGDVGDVAAVAIATVGFLVANQAMVAGVMALAEGARIRDLYRDGIAVRCFLWASNMSMGFLAGLSALTHRTTLIFAIFPVVMLEVAASRLVRVRRAKDGVDRLFQAAVEAHAPTELHDVMDAVVTSAQRLLGMPDVRVDAEPPRLNELGAELSGGTMGHRWLIAHRRDVASLRDEDQRMLEAVAAIGSAAMEKTALLEQVKQQAFHDPLTGLPNQLLFEERVESALVKAAHTGEHVAVLFLDIDNFKKVNDSLGHAVGNELLQLVSRRLARLVREGDTLARMGGDEFTMLLTGLAAPEDAVRAANTMLKALSHRPFLVDRRQLFVTASIGAALAPNDGWTAQALLKNSDVAMYQAKARGRACHQMYSAEMNASSHARLALEADLHTAVRRNELRVHYQPLIDLTTGSIEGVEALVRWEHPDLGLLAPDKFVPIAEQSGLIAEVDAWVLRMACAQGRAWADAGLGRLRIAVNVSARHVAERRLLDLVTETIASTGFDPHQLDLEVTESVAVHDDAQTVAVLEALHDLGVGIAIDDFGVGYSMLGRLRHFPINKLKIDRSFVEEITEQRESPMVAAMVAMGRSLDLSVVAEGVETEAQRAFLADLGCDLGQGYLFGRPVPSDEIAELLAGGGVVQPPVRMGSITSISGRVS